MSKSDQMYMELEEQANALGFDSVYDAVNNGYEIVGTELKPTIDLLRTQAHEEWLKEKEDSIKKLKKCISCLESFGYQWALEQVKELKAVIKFIEEGEV